MRYALPFGSGNAGKQPTFTSFQNVDTHAELPQPAITVVDAGGRAYFDLDWATAAATSIAYTTIAEVGGTELIDVISSALELPGSTAASAAVSSTNGYWTAGPLIGRALVRCGALNLSQSQISAYDPFLSSDAKVSLMVEALNDIGQELTTEIQGHLERTATFTTAGSALSYALPVDYLEMVPETGWDRSAQWQMVGPVSARNEQYLVATGIANVVGLQYRIEGNRITFPVAPADGLSCALKYVSRYWVQTALGAGPDSDHVQAATDVVLFDPLLVVRGLRWRFCVDKGLPEAGIALAEYEKRLAWSKGAVSSAPVLSFEGRTSDVRFIDTDNLPATGWGIP